MKLFSLCVCIVCFYGNIWKLLNLLSASVALICCANQLTSFYMKATLALSGLNSTERFKIIVILNTFILIGLYTNYAVIAY